MSVDIEEGRRLIAAATPGPWRFGVIKHNVGRILYRERATIAATYGPDLDRDANARLIAYAVNALPALLAELEAARRDAGRYRAIRNDAINPMRLFATQLDDELMVGVESMLTGADLDAAIDDAIAARARPPEAAK